MCLVRRLRRSFVHVELIVDESRQGHDLQSKSSVSVCNQNQSLKGPASACRRALTSLWCVLGFCTVLRLMDMTVRGGGSRSLMAVIRSGFRARASTLHQLTGWLMGSDRRTCTFRQALQFMLL